MNGYFTPLRRKMGVVTLVMACLVTMAWIRSFDFADIFQSDSAMFCSGEGRLYVTAPKPFEVNWEWPEWSVEEGAEVESALDAMKWKYRCLGFGYTEIQFFDVHMQVILVLYWSIVIPLTLFSAWLLLSKPRVPTVVSRDA